MHQRTIGMQLSLRGGGIVSADPRTRSWTEEWSDGVETAGRRGSDQRAEDERVHESRLTSCAGM